MSGASKRIAIDQRHSGQHKLRLTRDARAASSIDDVLQRRLGTDLEGVHKARLRLIFAATCALARGGKTTLTSIGRAIASKTTHKHGISTWTVGFKPTRVAIVASSRSVGSVASQVPTVRALGLPAINLALFKGLLVWARARAHSVRDSTNWDAQRRATALRRHRAVHVKISPIPTAFGTAKLRRARAAHMKLAPFKVSR